jgi:leucyl aminopeptidase (aminopeptidase T)
MVQSSLDTLYTKVARKVLKESLSLKKGESLTVETWNNGLPFAKHVVLEARKMGAIPLTVFEDEDAYVDGVKGAPDDMIGQMGKQEYALLSASDAYVFIPGPVLSSFSHRLAREQVVKSTEYGDAWYKAAAKAKLRGVRMAFGYINAEAEPVLGKSASSVVTHQLKAALADYASIGKKAKALAAALGRSTDVTITSPGSKLTLELTEIQDIDDGVVDAQDIAAESNVCYIPPGFVYNEVVPESVSGAFSFSPTVTRFGMIEDGTIEFQDGEVVAARSAGSKSVLSKLVAANSKSTRASSITIGLNPELKYGYGQNANSAGVVGVRVYGVTLTAKSASVSTKDKELVRRGKIN